MRNFAALDDELDVFRYGKRGFVFVIQGGLLFALIRSVCGRGHEPPPTAGEGEGSLPTSLK